MEQAQVQAVGVDGDVRELLNLMLILLIILANKLLKTRYLTPWLFEV